MEVTAVELRNVKGFGDGAQSVSIDLREDGVPVPRWVVVAGRNGAGKSTFLQAIALAIAGPDAARTLRDSFADWIHDGADSASAKVRLRFDARDGFTGSGNRPSISPRVGLTWTRSPDGPEPAMKPDTTTDWRPDRGPWSENPKGWFLVGYGPFRRLSGAPTEGMRIMMTPGRPTALASLFREEAALSEAIPWLRQIYLRRLEGNPDAASVEIAALQLLNDGLLPEGMRVDKVTSDGLWVRTPDQALLPLPSLSDGYRTVAALVVDLLRHLWTGFGHLSYRLDGRRVIFQHSGVVLIDEIDVHLHVSWQQRIGFWLKEHFPNLQFIVSTHSPFICQAADENGLIRLPAPGETAAARLVQGELFNRVVNGTADDAVLTDLFGLETPYSAPSVGLRAEVARLEQRMTDASITQSERDRLKELRQVLPQTQSEDVATALRQLALDVDAQG